MQRITPAASESGFAIGTILLAVILIAAITSAITIASRGNTPNASREEASLKASTLLHEAIKLSQAFDCATSNGYNPAEIIVARPGNPNELCTNEPNCLFATNCATGLNINPAMFDGSPRFGYLPEVNLGSVKVPVFYVEDVSFEVCKALNTSLTGINSLPPDVYNYANPAMGQWNETTGQLQAYEALQPGGTGQTFRWTEGCYAGSPYGYYQGGSQAFDPNAPNQNMSYMYFRVLR